MHKAIFEMLPYIIIIGILIYNNLVIISLRKAILRNLAISKLNSEALGKFLQRMKFSVKRGDNGELILMKIKKKGNIR